MEEIKIEEDQSQEFNVHLFDGLDKLSKRYKILCDRLNQVKKETANLEQTDSTIFKINIMMLTGEAYVPLCEHDGKYDFVSSFLSQRKSEIEDELQAVAKLIGDLGVSAEKLFDQYSGSIIR